MSDNPVVFDFETVEIMPDGSTRGSTEFYRHNFRASSCAFSERRDGRVVSWYVDGEDRIREELLKLQGRPLIAHNIQFEMGVCKCRFPDVPVNLYCDTMRLVQNYDNGGGDDAFEIIVVDRDEGFDEDEMEQEQDKEGVKYRPLQGLGLVISCKRILGLEDHKKEAHDWIYANVPEAKKGKAGAHLDKLPEDILERYNLLDVERTLALYEHITEHFLTIDFDWGFDHALYLNTTRFMVDAKIRGVRVERDTAAENARKVAREMVQIEQEFRQRFETEIQQVERARLLKRIRKLKTLKGRKAYVRRAKASPYSKEWQEDVAFNVGSNQQLAHLFVDVLKIQPKFFTAKGSPAFKSTMLGQWGEGGLLLGTRRKRMLVLKQLCNLYKLTEYDERFHIDIKAAGTATGRAAGGQHG